MAERGLRVNATTVYRWVQVYAPEVNRRIRRHLRPTSGRWHLDETYIQVKGRRAYLYRAVDDQGQTVDFLLSAKRDMVAALRFFQRALQSPHNGVPRALVVDRAPSYPSALIQLQREGHLDSAVQLIMGRRPEQPDRAGSSGDQTPGPIWARIQDLRFSETNDRGIRSTGDDSKGTGGGGPREQVVHRSRIHGRDLRSGGMNGFNGRAPCRRELCNRTVFDRK